ncbi:nitronate monooxygenase [Xanthobacter sp. KR7-225]|uniref:NAD(P)H-dependent flavin oxidoreductase n=1 Tax=Xanthobacter sp. KR7-225 TaxID=3156613 RepID=UPI0032B3E58A
MPLAPRPPSSAAIPQEENTARARWPDRRLLDLFGIDLPILLGPLAGAGTPELAIAVTRAGGLGALPCAMYDLERFAAALAQVRVATDGPVNANFFVHRPPAPDPVAMLAWRARLAPYYVELGLDPQAAPPAGGRTPFDADFCALVERLRPEVVSFHFGLPEPALLERVKATGAKVISAATTVAEARYLADHGCDAVIAMGLEAGGHRGTFLDADIPGAMARQPGTFALVPQVADAVPVPVIAAGGIADGRGIAAALVLGASAAQIGTVFLLAREARIPEVHRAALRAARDDATALTNLFTGRPARGLMNRLMHEIGPMSADAPAFPLAGGALAPLRAEAEAAGSSAFTNLWAGQAAALSLWADGMAAGDIVARLAADARARLGAPA